MLFFLPKDIESIISEYYLDYNTKKLLVIKHKIDKKIKDLNTIVSNIETIEQLSYGWVNHPLNLLCENSEIKNSLEKYTKKCSECLKVPKDIIEYKNRQVNNVQNYEKISNMLGSNILKKCNHSFIIAQSDYDYHRPRYDYICTLCSKMLYFNEIPEHSEMTYV